MYIYRKRDYTSMGDCWMSFVASINLVSWGLITIRKRHCSCVIFFFSLKLQDVLKVTVIFCIRTLQQTEAFLCVQFTLSLRSSLAE